MKNIFLIAILSMVLMSCSSDDNESFSTQNIEFTTIGQGSLSGSLENPEVSEQNIVITNQNDWAELISQMDSVNNQSNNFTEIDVDFDIYQVVVVIDEVRPVVFTLNILNVVENETNINVIFISEEANFDGAITSQPYHIVKIPKSGKPVVFE